MNYDPTVDQVTAYSRWLLDVFTRLPDTPPAVILLREPEQPPTRSRQLFADLEILLPDRSGDHLVDTVAGLARDSYPELRTDVWGAAIQIEQHDLLYHPRTAKPVFGPTAWIFIIDRHHNLWTAFKQTHWLDEHTTTGYWAASDPGRPTGPLLDRVATALDHLDSKDPQ